MNEFVKGIEQRILIRKFILAFIKLNCIKNASREHHLKVSGKFQFQCLLYFKIHKTY